MKHVQAPEVYEKKHNEIAVFLAGGCGNRDWANTVIKQLNKSNLNSLVLYDPYNPNITDNYAQIEWEFNYLNNYINDHFIFSIYFDKYTDQPISMYELGRASVLCKEQAVKVGPHNNSLLDKTQVILLNYGFPMVVSIHPEAPKREDIISQCKLANVCCEVCSPVEHYKRIYNEYKDIKHHMM